SDYDSTRGRCDHFVGWPTAADRADFILAVRDPIQLKCSVGTSRGSGCHDDAALDVSQSDVRTERQRWLHARDLAADCMTWFGAITNINHGFLICAHYDFSGSVASRCGREGHRGVSERIHRSEILALTTGGYDVGARL